MIAGQINIHRLEKLGLVKTHFPLHRIWEIERNIFLPELLKHKEDGSEGNLKAQWKGNLFTLDLPLHLIRQYFGEKVGVCFLYIHTYMVWLLGLAIIGVLFFLDSVTRLNKISFFEEDELYCFLTIAWSTLFLEMWKRKQEKFAIEWGQTFSEEVEIQRPEFQGKLRRSPVTDDRYELYYDSGKRLIYQTVGVVLSLVFVGLTVACIGFILYKRAQTRAAGGIMFLYWDLSGTLYGIINAVQIEIFNKLFELLAYKTTELENYRYQSEFENSYILKSYLFQIVNSYASIVYIAFFQSHYEGCYALHFDGTRQPRSCMFDLQVQLATIYCVHFVKNLVVMGKAAYQRWKRQRLGQDDSWKLQWREKVCETETLRTQLEMEFSKSAYIAKGIDGTFQHYLELMIQYGYVTLFAVAFPLAPLLAFFNNALELRVDRFKLLSLTRRPVPAGARGLGPWLVVLDVMTTMAIFSNSALLCFTLSAFEDFRVLPDEPLMWFAIMLIAIFVIRKAASILIPEVPYRYELVKKRHAVIVERHIKKYRPTRRVVSIDSEWVNMSILGTH